VYWVFFVFVQFLWNFAERKNPQKIQSQEILYTQCNKVAESRNKEYVLLPFKDLVAFF
jgi:hypothetical protein